MAKDKRISFKGFDAAHYKKTNLYANTVRNIMTATTDDIVAMIINGGGKIDPDKVFSFADYPRTRQQVDTAINGMVGKIRATIETGARNEWLSACRKNDEFLSSILRTTKLSRERLATFQDKNLDALNAFQTRKVDGLDLSQRVWRYADQFRDHLELAIDVGIGDGRSAAELSRDVRQDLKDPNRLYRRVRDKRGNLVLSKNARAFHPGQGIYRSSYKNAMRLTRSEINMAYRESDFRRWQQLDFVIGIELHRSNHDPLCKCPMCERFVGRYPKTFKFVGWHPQCMCYATPVLVSDEEFGKQELSDLKSALHGTEYRKLAVKGVVNDVPQGFKEWVEANAGNQKHWSSTPYFIKDNFVDGKLSKGLKPSALNPVVTAKDEPVVKRTPFEKLSPSEQSAWRDFVVDIYPVDFGWEQACRKYHVAGLDAFLQTLEQAVNNNEHWRMAELKAEYNRLDGKLQSAMSEVRQIGLDLLDKLDAANENGAIYIGEQYFARAERLRNVFKSESTRRFPDYFRFNKDGDIGSLAVSFTNLVNSGIAKAKTDYADAVTKAKDLIAKYSAQDTAKLQSLLNETPTRQRYMGMIAVEINMECTNMVKTIDAKANGAFNGLAEECAKKGIEYREVKKLEKELTPDEIIERVGGGDMTAGSCSSLALTYAANRSGMNVLDFRDGESRKFFADGINCREICAAGGGVTTYASGMEMMKMTEIGKEYYLAIGRHAAIVRQVSKGKYEYLELQSRVRNGWKPLNASEFGSRFSARGRMPAEMIEISKLAQDKAFGKMMGYINTESDKQKKGASGSIK